MLIREAHISDSQQLSALSAQLGYELSHEKLKKQLEQILSSDADIVLVIALKSKLIAYLHAVKNIRLTSPPFMEIVALIVDEAERNKGYGAALIKELESRADQLNIRIRCNNQRKLALDFYLQQDYIPIKEQIVFNKSPHIKQA